MNQWMNELIDPYWEPNVCSCASHSLICNSLLQPPSVLPSSLSPGTLLPSFLSYLFSLLPPFLLSLFFPSFGRQSVRKRGEIFHLLIHSLNNHSSYEWGQEPGNPSGPPIWVAEAQVILDATVASSSLTCWSETSTSIAPFLCSILLLGTPKVVPHLIK